MYYTIFAKREENFLAKIDVAPLAGARIEIIRSYCRSVKAFVAPLAGARIEIPDPGTDGEGESVAPLAGARIEIRFWVLRYPLLSRRSPRGSAD